jgi:hypothetical protein
MLWTFASYGFHDVKSAPAVATVICCPQPSTAVLYLQQGVAVPMLPPLPAAPRPIVFPERMPLGYGTYPG